MFVGADRGTGVLFVGADGIRGEVFVVIREILGVCSMLGCLLDDGVSRGIDGCLWDSGVFLRWLGAFEMLRCWPDVRWWRDVWVVAGCWDGHGTLGVCGIMRCLAGVG